jgi:hypothetical protein
MVPLPEFLRGFVAHQIALWLDLDLDSRFFLQEYGGTLKKIVRFSCCIEEQTLKPLCLSPELAR